MTLVIVPTSAIAERYTKKSKNPLLKFVGVGVNLAGHRFHTIINTVGHMDIGSSGEMIKFREWLQQVTCRLYPDGILITGVL